MRRVANYFCPDDGWEGIDSVCPICSQPSEPLDVGEHPNIQKARLEEEPTPDFQPLDDFGDDSLPEEREEEY